MVERDEPEAKRRGGPSLADELVGREALQRLQSTSEVVGGVEVGEMPFELNVIVIVVASDGRVLNGAVHALSDDLKS